MAQLFGVSLKFAPSRKLLASLPYVNYVYTRWRPNLMYTMSRGQTLYGKNIKLQKDKWSGTSSHVGKTKRIKMYWVQ